MSLSSKKSIKGYNRGANKCDFNERIDEAYSWYPYGFDVRPSYLDGDNDYYEDRPHMTMKDCMQGKLFEMLGKLQIRSAAKLAEDWWWRFW